jgi:hypothetical protein
MMLFAERPKMRRNARRSSSVRISPDGENLGVLDRLAGHRARIDSGAHCGLDTDRLHRAGDRVVGVPMRIDDLEGL